MLPGDEYITRIDCLLTLLPLKLIGYRIRHLVEISGGVTREVHSRTEKLSAVFKKKIFFAHVLCCGFQ
jgi:hypothetical protein